MLLYSGFVLVRLSFLYAFVHSLILEEMVKNLKSRVKVKPKRYKATTIKNKENTVLSVTSYAVAAVARYI